ncbi:MAG: carboxypeptidase regulatory-like domain-containing protein [Bacteroidetes bacterium]|nr:carboxypeptidase regulatory-like domain-containing protein [Bacteroidota bacterium]
MKKPTLFILLFLLLSCSLFAQNTNSFGRFSEYYQLSPREAHSILVDQAPFDSSWLHSPVGMSDTMPVQRLPFGYYLAVSARTEGIDIEVITRAPVQMTVFPSRRRSLEFVLTDTLGRRISDAKASIQGKKIRFDTRMQVYRIPRPRQGRMLQIKTGGHTWYYEIDVNDPEDLRQYRWERFTAHPVGRVLGLSWLYVKDIPRFPRQLIQKIRYHNFNNYRRQAKWDKKEAWNGYVAFSQPKYRPGDSLHVKAWVADYKGKPWNKPVELKVYSTYTGKVTINRILQPSSPGVFTWQTRLNDSMEIDRPYNFFFSNPHPRKRGWFHQYRTSAGSVTGSMYYEDYVLDEVKYSFTQDKSEYAQGDSVVFHISGKDATGQALNDGRYSLVVKSVSTAYFYSEKVAIPDTIWQSSGPLQASGTLDLRLPDRFLPNAQCNMTAMLYATNSAGELQQLNLSFLVDQRSIPLKPLKVWIDRGWLYADWKGQPSAGKQVKLQEFTNEDTPRTSFIVLPYRVPVRQDVRMYQFMADNESISLSPDDSRYGGHRVSELAFRAGDTAVFTLVNPHRIPVQYRIRRGKEEWERGVLTDSTLELRYPQADKYDWGAYYTFMWGGQDRQLDNTIPLYKNRLDVTIDQPETITPGEQVQVKVQVKDYRDRPVAGADLTAGAFNALFKGSKPYNAPSISYSQRRTPPENPFQIARLECSGFSQPVSDHWYKRLHLDTIPYYQMRHTGATGNAPATYLLATDIYPRAFQNASFPGADTLLPGLPAPTDSLYFQKPQVAPFVVDQLNAQPIYLIWLNRQLVYYHGATDNAPYSFIAEPGYNFLKIRTRMGEYSIDSIYLEKGKKYTIALSQSGWKAKWEPVPSPGNTWAHARVRLDARPDSLEVFERRVVQQSMLLLRNQYSNANLFFWQDAGSVHALKSNYNQVQIVGPFSPGYLINGVLPGGVLCQFPFEYGYEYEVMEHRERLYDTQWMKHSAGRLPRKLPVRSMFDWALGRHHVTFPPPVYHFSPPGPDAQGKASLRVQYYKKDSVLLGYAVRNDSLCRLYRPENYVSNDLPPGRYRVTLYTSRGALCEQEVELKRDTLLCINFSGRPFRPCTAEERFERVFKFLLVKTPSVSTTQPLRNNYQQLSGYGSVLQGRITDSSGEELIGASVYIYQNGVLIRGAVTDVNGNYRIQLPPGLYTVSVSYTGYNTRSLPDMVLPGGASSNMDVMLEDGGALQEVVVSAGSVSTRSWASATLAGKVSGISSIDGGAINIRGYRSPGTVYYIDGIRVPPAPPPVQDVEAFAAPVEVRSAFRDHAYWQPRLQTDAQGTAVFQARFPDDLTTWEAFAVAADTRKRAGTGTTMTRSFKPVTAQLTTPRFAVAGDQFEASGRIVQRGKDSVSVTTRFLLNKQVTDTHQWRVLEGMAEYFPVNIPTGPDSVTFTYEMVSGRNTDGEQRSIPVLPVGTVTTEGQFWVLENDTTLLLSYPAGAGAVTLHAENNPIELMLADVDYLYTYPYGCNEHTSSRLIALLHLKKLKAIRKQPFTHEKDIQACLKRLANAQLPNGTWGWWAEGSTNDWMTKYVTGALWAAKQAGYTVQGLDRALSALRLRLPAMNPYDQCATLTLLRQCEVNIDCLPYLIFYDTLKKPSLANRLNAMKINQLCGNKVQKDSLVAYMHRTTMGGLYFGKGETDWYNRRAVQTIQAYDIALAAGWNDIARGIERYWLQSRPVRRNTIETAQILERLLPALLAGQDTLRPSRLHINEKTLKLFPVTERIDPAQGATVSVTKTGSGPVFFTAYRQFQETAPAARSDLFEVSSRLLLANGTPATQLKYGESAMLEVRVEVKEAADYVMIEVPIPAGCGYGPKMQPGGPEVHREYFKDKTAIFCERLPVGKYVFQVLLEPRFTGRFTLNPVRVEQMYFPVFYGRNEVKKVEIDR